MSDSNCGLCGHRMPPGEEMFKYHGYSGPCPAPPLAKTKPANGLDEFVQRTVERVCPAPLVVSETALAQLRPVFGELLDLRVAVETICMRYEAVIKGGPTDVCLGDAIREARALVKDGAA